MAKAEKTQDLGERANILADAAKIQLNELGAIPILYYSSLALVSSDVDGWNDNLMNSRKTRWLSLKK
ncbi:hypothetical protein AX23_16190 [Brucella melitensis 548]|nr:hypothetical protein AX23_16190 [Brucella melitensis 548]